MVMQSTSRQWQSSPPVETAVERDGRLRREADIIAQGQAEIAAGLGIGDAALRAWLDELDRDPKAPLPRPAADPRS